MFEVGFSELLLIFVIALVVLGPAKLPKLVSQVGRWAGKAKAMARQFREQLENEINLDELAKTQAKSPPPTDTTPPVEPTPWAEPAPEPAPWPEHTAHAETPVAADTPVAAESTTTDATAPVAAEPAAAVAVAAAEEPVVGYDADPYNTIHAAPPPPETRSSTPFIETHERGI